MALLGLEEAFNDIFTALEAGKPITNKQLLLAQLHGIRIDAVKETVSQLGEDCDDY